MDNRLEKIWEYLDGDLNPSQQSQFLKAIAEDDALREQYEEIKGMHLLLMDQSQVVVPDFLADGIMDSIAAENIANEIDGDSTILRLIPFIIILFTVLLSILVTIGLLTKGIIIDDNILAVLQTPTTFKIGQYMGYLSLLAMIMLVFYKYTHPSIKDHSN